MPQLAICTITKSRYRPVLCEKNPEMTTYVVILCRMNKIELNLFCCVPLFSQHLFTIASGCHITDLSNVHLSLTWGIYALHLLSYVFPWNCRQAVVVVDSLIWPTLGGAFLFLPTSHTNAPALWSSEVSCSNNFQPCSYLSHQSMIYEAGPVDQCCDWRAAVSATDIHSRSPPCKHASHMPQSLIGLWKHLHSFFLNSFAQFLSFNSSPSCWSGDKTILSLMALFCCC